MLRSTEEVTTLQQGMFKKGTVDGVTNFNLGLYKTHIHFYEAEHANHKKKASWHRDLHILGLLGMSLLLTSNPCFSEGTQTSLLAAQSAWLEAENTDVGELGPASMERKRVTSLALPAADLAMVMALLERGRRGAVRKYMCNILNE